METQVFRKEPTRFTMYGAALSQDLTIDFKQSISPGLATRLVNYASKRMQEAGFDSLVQIASPLVYTLDGDSAPADRSYSVKFSNEKGGYIEVIGIFTRKGWPSLDYGFAVGQD